LYSSAVGSVAEALIDADLDVGEGAESWAGIFCIVAEVMAATRVPENSFLLSLYPSVTLLFLHLVFVLWPRLYSRIPVSELKSRCLKPKEKAKEVVFDRTSLGTTGKRDFEGSFPRLSFPANENSQHRRRNTTESATD
jgi:hypothetical protein